MACPQTGASLDICPTRDEIVSQLLALLPRGRAWGTHDGGPIPGSTLYRFWTAVADVWASINGRICDLAREFFCASQVETNDLWMEEYGLPDGCDPFPDLCSKVAAIGGTRCEYYTAICAAAGWAIDCADVNDSCGAKAGGAKAGRAMAGPGIRSALLVIRVRLGESPAFTGVASDGSNGGTAGPPPPQSGRLKAGQPLSCRGIPPTTPPFAGVAQAGGRLSCPADITGLVCLVERITGAHMVIRYEVVP